MPTASNVIVGKPNLEVSGGLLSAPLGTPRPTDATTALDAAYQDNGYVSDAGAAITNDRSTEDIFAWGGVKVRSVQTTYSASVTITLIESKAATTLRTVFGNENVTVDASGNISVKWNEKVLPHQQFVIDMKDGDNARRLDIGNGQVVSVGDVTYVDGEAIAYELTISCDPDENGDVILEYLTGDSADAPVEGASVPADEF